eukprot:13376436-Alexandrium_andersonii.AAC.1
MPASSTTNHPTAQPTTHAGLDHYSDLGAAPMPPPELGPALPSPSSGAASAQPNYAAPSDLVVVRHCIDQLQAS